MHVQCAYTYAVIIYVNVYVWLQTICSITVLCVMCLCDTSSVCACSMSLCLRDARVKGLAPLRDFHLDAHGHALRDLQTVADVLSQLGTKTARVLATCCIVVVHR